MRAAIEVSSITVQVLSDCASIAELEHLPFVAELPPTARPGFLLASTVPRQWLPRAIVVRDCGEIQGFVYLKERKFGVRTGILYADFSMGGCVAAPPDRREFVLERGLVHLLEHTAVRGLRLRFAPGGFEVALLERLAAGIGATCQVRQDSYHAIIPLSENYESFLSSFGYKARRNLRYYRRRFENSGHTYVERPGLKEVEEVARRLETLSVVGASTEGVTRSLNMFARHPRPLLAGLRHKDGEWVAILGGWLEGRLPVVFFQMNNDRDYPNDSLSSVLRAFFFETLIGLGYREVAFWGGVGEPYRQIAQAQPAISIFVDVQTRTWRAIRSMVRTLGPHLPGSFRYAVEWINPASPSR